MLDIYNIERKTNQQNRLLEYQNIFKPILSAVAEVSVYTIYAGYELERKPGYLDQATERMFSKISDTMIFVLQSFINVVTPSLPGALAVYSNSIQSREKETKKVQEQVANLKRRFAKYLDKLGLTTDQVHDKMLEIPDKKIGHLWLYAVSGYTNINDSVYSAEAFAGMIPISPSEKKSLTEEIERDKKVSETLLISLYNLAMCCTHQVETEIFIEAANQTSRAADRAEVESEELKKLTENIASKLDEKETV